MTTPCNAKIKLATMKPHHVMQAEKSVVAKNKLQIFSTNLFSSFKNSYFFREKGKVQR